MASATIILFDHVLTFDAEVECIWKAKWSAGKVLFLVNRYYTLASVVFVSYGYFNKHLTNEFCRHFIWWQGVTGLLACFIAESILQMRLYAMYSLNKKLLVVMVVAFVASIASSAWILHDVISKTIPTAIRLPDDTRFCMPIGVADHFYTFWIPMLIFECFLCGLAIARAFSTFRVGRGSNWGNARRLIIVLFRDSIAYFLVICATYLTCLLTWVLAPVTLLEVPITFSVAMSCVLANRIILNVRELNSEVVNPTGQASHQQHVKWDTLQHPSQHGTKVSFAENGTVLNQYEMDKLRGLRSSPSIKIQNGRRTLVL